MKQNFRIEDRNQNK